MIFNRRKNKVTIDRDEVKEAFKSKSNYLRFWLDIAIKVGDERLEKIIVDMLQDELEEKYGSQ